jgi:hypothetical protein
MTLDGNFVNLGIGLTKAVGMTVVVAGLIQIFRGRVITKVGISYWTLLLIGLGGLIFLVATFLPSWFLGFTR